MAARLGFAHRLALGERGLATRLPRRARAILAPSCFASASMASVSLARGSTRLKTSNAGTFSAAASSRVGRVAQTSMGEG